MRTRINISLVLLLVNTEQKQFCFVMPRGPFFSRLFFFRFCYVVKSFVSRRQTFLIKRPFLFVYSKFFFVFSLSDNPPPAGPSGAHEQVVVGFD